MGVRRNARRPERGVLAVASPADIVERLKSQRAHLQRYGIAHADCESTLNDAAHALADLSALVNELNRKLVLGPLERSPELQTALDSLSKTPSWEQ